MGMAMVLHPRRTQWQRRRTPLPRFAATQRGAFRWSCQSAPLRVRRNGKHVGGSLPCEAERMTELPLTFEHWAAGTVGVLAALATIVIARARHVAVPKTTLLLAAVGMLLL